jgi:crotonobetainyl-CoA:carnitine CoA-transferase CaiB-like acyl-CoA transferase
MAIKFTEEEERKLYAGMYILFKGITVLDSVRTDVFDRMDAKNEIEKKEAKDFFEKILKVAEARARIDEEYIFTENEDEAKRREQLEDEINEWLEDNVFNDKLKTYLSIKD